MGAESRNRLFHRTIQELNGLYSFFRMCGYSVRGIRLVLLSLLQFFAGKSFVSNFMVELSIKLNIFDSNMGKQSR